MNEDDPEFSTILREHELLKAEHAEHAQELKAVVQEQKKLTARLIEVATMVTAPSIVETMDSHAIIGLTAMLTEFRKYMDITPRIDGLERLLTGLEETIARVKQAVPKEKPPMSPDPSYGGDTMKTATSPIPHFWGQALTAGGPNTGRLRNSWEENQINEHPKFARANMTHGGGEATVYFDPKNYSALELWGKVYSIDDLVLETYTVILALMSDARNACPPGYVKEFFINPSQILDLKGFRRWGEDRRVAMRRFIEAVKLLSEWTTDYSGFPLPPDKRGKPQFAEKRGCKIFHVLSSWHYGEQGELFEKENGELDHAPVSIHCVSGAWLADWMNKDGGYFWVQYMSRKLLEIPGANEAERYAKRIGMLLLGFAAGTNHVNKEIRYTVREILIEIVAMPTDEYRGLGGREARKGQDWARRTDKALFGWREDDGGDFIEGGGEDCSGVYHPGAFDLLVSYGALVRYRKGDADNPYPDPGTRQAGWQDRWLDTPVFMLTPEAAEKLAIEVLPIAEPAALPDKTAWNRRGMGKPVKKLVKEQFLDTATAERLRAEISRQFPNQTKAAEYFGCTQSGLSRVLNRHRAPGVEMAGKIKTFLDSPAPD